MPRKIHAGHSDDAPNLAVNAAQLALKRSHRSSAQGLHKMGGSYLISVHKVDALMPAVIAVAKAITLLPPIQRTKYNTVTAASVQPGTVPSSIGVVMANHGTAKSRSAGIRNPRRSGL